MREPPGRAGARLQEQTQREQHSDIISHVGTSHYLQCSELVLKHSQMRTLVLELGKLYVSVGCASTPMVPKTNIDQELSIARTQANLPRELLVRETKFAIGGRQRRGIFSLGLGRREVILS